MLDFHVIKSYNLPRGDYMGGRHQKNTAERVIRMQQQGRGNIDAKEYTPGIRTYEISSKGKSARIFSYTANRVCHCLSQLEKLFLIILDFDPAVTEIYEQVCLKLEDTLTIAAALNFKHPYADTSVTIMTTDFVYVRDGRQYAVAIKHTDDLKSERTQEKLAIEKAYWEKKHVSWRIVTEKDISRTHAENLVWLHSGEPIEQLVPDNEMRQNLLDAILDLYEDYTIPFSEIITEIESYAGLQTGTVIQLFKHLVCTGRIHLDLCKPIHITEPRTLSMLSAPQQPDLAQRKEIPA